MSARAKKIILIGECMLELRAGQLLSLPLPTELSFAGDVFNVALYIARLLKNTDQTAFYSALGDDPFSKLMSKAWCDEGIDCQFVKKINNAMPGLYLIENDAKGERHFYYYRSSSAARLMLENETEASLLSVLNHYDYIYLSGITVAILSEQHRDLLLAVLKIRRQQGCEIAFDLNYRPRLWADKKTAQAHLEQFLQTTTIALPTLEDYALLFEEQSVDQLTARFWQYGITEIVIKNGLEGCYYLEADKLVHCPVVPVQNVVDTTAAGDSFNAGYLAARMQSQSQQDSILLGQNLASVVVQYPGAIVPACQMPYHSL